MDDELRPARIALGIGGACSLVITILLNANTADSRAVDGPQSLALTAVCLVPVALAAGALFRRRILMLPAAILGIVVSPVLWSGLPLLFVPGVGYAVAYIRVPSLLLPWFRRIAAVVIPVVLAMGGMFLLFSDTAQRCGSDGNSTFCSTVPPTINVSASIVCAALAVVAGWLLGSPQQAVEISPRNPQVVGLVPHRPTQAK